jgi:2-polyprenyl-3-methyl-5-hydroxy-6-metoxy-1,4-benzoquinol methylase
MASMTAAEVASPALVFETMTAFQRSSALCTAIELDVFRAIGEGLTESKSIAQRCGTSERGMRILLDFLTIMHFLKKENGLYYHTATSAAFLDPKSPACVASVAKFMNNAALRDSHDRLTETVRSGTTTLPGDGTVEDENPMWVDFAHSMAPMMGPMAAPLGKIALDGLNGPVRVLDIAAGHGLFGIEVAKQNPGARIVALDWGKVLEVAKANAVKAGVEGRYETLPGSAFDVEYGGPYDIVLLTNFLHHFDPPTCVMILKKVLASLKPGGRAAALEFVPSEDRLSPPMAGGFSLTMLTTTPAGDAYTYKELDAMYLEAGYARTTEHPLTHTPHTVVMGFAK